METKKEIKFLHINWLKIVVFYKYHSDVTNKIPQAFNAYYCIFKKQN